METFFNIRYEFDPQAVHGEIWQAVSQGKTGYICVADANILSLVHRNADYRRTVDEALFSICDSSWVPVFLRCLYGIRRPHYCGAQIFRDLVSSGHYRMAFLGGNAQVLHSLRAAIAPWNPAVAAMPFEKALGELETIVQRLERGDVPLEESIAIYERGEALKKRCDALLKDAEARVQKITLAADGSPAGTQPLDA